MIIGLVGFIGSGKGTVGSLLTNHYGFKPESFAKPLKDACAAIFGWHRENLEGDTSYSREFREQIDPYWSGVLGRPNFTPRLALQLMGTEAGRDVFGANLWTASCIRRCQAKRHSVVENFVVTDCRFMNEMKAIKEANGIIIRVKRGPEPTWMITALASGDVHDHMKAYDGTFKPMIHQSEWDWIGSMDKIDYTINNEEGNPASMEYQLYDILVELKITQNPFRKSVWPTLESTL